MGALTAISSVFWTVVYALHGSETLTIELGGKATTFDTPSKEEFLIVFRNAVMERRILNDLQRHLEPDDVFYDVGAHSGLYTCLLGKHLISDQTFAFDPHPDRVTELRKNIEQNGIDASVHNCALSNTTGEIEFGLRTHKVASDGTPGNDTVRVESVVGDDYMEQESLPSPDVIKIDVEGAEYQVLDGLRKLLDSPECRLVYCEIHPDNISDFGEDPEEVHQLLEDANYDIEEVARRKSQYMIRATKRERSKRDDTNRNSTED